MQIESTEGDKLVVERGTRGRTTSSVSDTREIRKKRVRAIQVLTDRRGMEGNLNLRIEWMTVS